MISFLTILDLAECFNDYFINIAANLKEPIEQCTFDDLKEHNKKIQKMLILRYQKLMKILFSSIYQLFMFQKQLV